MAAQGRPRLGRSVPLAPCFIAHGSGLPKVACAHFSSGHFGAVDNSAGGGLDLGIRPSLGSQDEGGWGTGGDTRRYGRDEIGEDEHSGHDQYQ